MKKHAVQENLTFTGRLSAFILLTSLAFLTSLAGCGSGNPSDADLDRVPNVPASTRSSQGATAAAPTGR